MEINTVIAFVKIIIILEWIILFKALKQVIMKNLIIFAYNAMKLALRAQATKKMIA